MGVQSAVVRLRSTVLTVAVIATTLLAGILGAAPGHAATGRPATGHAVATQHAASPGWQVAFTGPAVTTSSYYISCGSSSQCQTSGATIAGSSLLGSADGGKTWTAEQPPAGIAGVGPVSCGSAGSCQELAVTTSNVFVLIGTTNNGKSWTVEQIPANTRLTNVSCATAADCEASGTTATGAALILGTTNGGKTWTAQPLPSGLQEVFDLACGSATDCQAVAVTGNSTGVILGTSNGGKSWTAERSLGTTLMFVIACGSPASCQTLGQTSTGASAVLGTANGGKTWSPETLPSGEFPTTVGCASATSCVAAGQTPNATAFTAATTNGGKSWQTVTTPAGFAAVNQVACHTICVAAGQSTSDIGALAATGNNAHSWTVGRLPIQFYALNAIACSGGCFAVGASNNGGAAISATAGGHLPAPGTELLSSGGALSGATCHAQTCVAAGAGQAWYSGDGGRSWHGGTLPTGTAPLSGVSCGSAVNCVAVGHTNTVLTTADGGRTWHAGSLPGSARSVTAVSCGSATTCMAVGESPAGVPLVYLTSDAGRSWTAKSPVAAGTLATVGCDATGHCHIAGQSASGGALMLNTSDGGKTWTKPTIPSDITSVTALGCKSPAFCDALAGTATGQNVILNSTNIGSTWTAQTIPAQVTGLNAISCDPSAGCVATGTDVAAGTVVLRDTAAKTSTAIAAGRAWPSVWPKVAHQQASASERATAPEQAGTRWQAAPVGFKAASLNWVSAQDGWVLGLAPCGTKTCSDVLNTNDGGRTWTLAGTIPAPIPQPNNGNGITEIRMGTPVDGWAYGPELYRTVSGGRAWTRMTIPGGDKQVLSLSTDSDGSYIVTSPCAVGSGGCGAKHLTLWRWMASSWTKVPVTVPVSFAPELAMYGKTVYVGGPENASLSSFLLGSTDGTHFAPKAQPCAASQALVLVSIAPTSATKVALLCDGNPGFSQAVKTVYLSTDAGKTDKYAGQLGLYGIQAQLAASPSGNLAVASASDGSFMYINDTRTTAWTMTIGFGDGGLGWNDLQFVTDNEAWVVYSPGNLPASYGKVFVTRDGGRHWTLAAF